MCVCLRMCVCEKKYLFSTFHRMFSGTTSRELKQCSGKYFQYPLTSVHWSLAVKNFQIQSESELPELLRKIRKN